MEDDPGCRAAPGPVPAELRTASGLLVGGSQGPEPQSRQGIQSPKAREKGGQGERHKAKPRGKPHPGFYSRSLASLTGLLGPGSSSICGLCGVSSSAAPPDVPVLWWELRHGPNQPDIGDALPPQRNSRQLAEDPQAGP